MGDSSDNSELTENDAVREILKGAGVVYAGLIIEKLLAFGAQRFAAVYLSVGAFGSLISGTALLDVAGILGSVGFSAGFARYLPRVDSDQQRPLTKYALMTVLPVAILLAIVIFLFADVIAGQVFGEPGLTTTFRVFGVVVPFAVLLNLGVGGVRGMKLPRYRVYVKNLIQPGLRFGLIAAAVVVGAGELGFVAGYAIPFIIAGGVAIGLFWHSLPTDSNSEGARKTFPEFFRYSFPFVINKLSSFLYRSTDIFLILYFIGDSAVGEYVVAYALAQLLAMFSTAFDFLSTPISSQLEKDDRIKEILTVQKTITRWGTIVTVAATIPLALFSSDLLQLIYRPAYASAETAMVILLVGFALRNTFLPHAPILGALGRSKLIALNNVLAGTANISANVVLIPHYGITGAAFATMLSYTVLSALQAGEVRYFTGQTTLTRKLVTPILLGALLTGLTTPVAQLIPGTLLWTFGTSAVLASVYPILVVIVTGLTQTDVMAIRSIERRLGISSDSLDRIIRLLS